jgi:beta-glucosidase-like glycosyl hydrolase
MTDSFAIAGMTNLFPLGECHKLAMKAGNDMVMTSYRIASREVCEYMLDGYKSGMVSEEQITEAAGRVIAAQNQTLKKAGQDELTEAQMEKAVEMCRKSIAVTLCGTDEPRIRAGGDPERGVQKCRLCDGSRIPC